MRRNNADADAVDDELGEGNDNDNNSSYVESNDRSDGENDDDDDVFGSILSWEDEDLPSVSGGNSTVSNELIKINSTNSLIDYDRRNRRRAAPADGEEDEDRGEDGTRSQGQAQDMMFGFAAPLSLAAFSSNRQTSHDQQPTQQPQNQNDLSQQASSSCGESSGQAASASLYSNGNMSFGASNSFVVQQQQQFAAFQNLFSIPRQGQVSIQQQQQQQVNSPMMQPLNPALGSLPQMMQQSMPQSFQLPSQAMHVQGAPSRADQQQHQGSPPLRGVNSSLGSLQQMMNQQQSSQPFQLSGQTAVTQLTTAQDQLQQQQQSQQRNSSAGNSSFAPLPQLIQQQTPQTFQMPTQAVHAQVPPSQQDLWNLFQQQFRQQLLPQQQQPQNQAPPSNPVVTMEMPAWLISSLQQQIQQQQQSQQQIQQQQPLQQIQQQQQQAPSASKNTDTSTTGGPLGLKTFDENLRAPAQEQAQQQPQRRAVAFSYQVFEQREPVIRNDSDPNPSSSQAQDNDNAQTSTSRKSSSGSSTGRSGRGRGRFRPKTLVPDLSEVIAEPVSSVAGYANQGTGVGVAGSEEYFLPSSRFGSNEAHAIAEKLLEEQGKKSSSSPHESHSCPSASAANGAGIKASSSSSKAMNLGAPTPHRRKSTSLAQQATLAMNAAKECAAKEAQKEQQISQQQEQLKQNTSNSVPRQNSLPIVSHDEMSDTSFRKATSYSEVQRHQQPSNLMRPPPPASASTANAQLSYLNATWDGVNLTDKATSSKVAAASPLQQQAHGDDDCEPDEHQQSKSHKRSAAASSPHSADSNKKRSSISSIHDYVSTSETDGGATTDPDTKDSMNASGLTRVSSIDKSLGMELSEDDRTRMNRDRNREHARNTRLRKKAYLEKLKTTVDDLCRERDSLVQDRATSASRLLEQQKLRVEVVLGYFALRQRCERRRDLWAGLCEENVVCTLPVTPYRSFPASEVQSSKCQRTVLGIDALIADASSFHVLLDSIIDYNSVFNPKSPYYACHAIHVPPQAQQGSSANSTSPPLLVTSASPKIQVQYTLVTEDAVSSGAQLMARWTMTTLNAVSLGAAGEISKNGMLYAKFNSANKIVALEHMFDVMAFMLQLKSGSGSSLSAQVTGTVSDASSSAASNSNGFKIIPNTVQTAQRYYDVPMILTVAERPYTIMQVNSLWEDMTGYRADMVVGKTSARILQPHWQHRANLPAPYQDPALAFLMMEVRFKRSATAALVNANSNGDLFRNVLQVFPLSTDGKITHYLGLTIFHQFLGINWNTVVQNPMMFQQLQPGANTVTSGSTLSSSIQSSIARSVTTNNEQLATQRVGFILGPQTGSSTSLGTTTSVASFPTQEGTVVTDGSSGNSVDYKMAKRGDGSSCSTNDRSNIGN